MKKFVIAAFAIALAVIATLVWRIAPFEPRTSLSIVAGSENQALEPIIRDWAEANRVDVSITYQGSVDISRALGAGQETPFDAVWPAHSLWIELGDTDRVVKHRESILRSPIVLGLRHSIAEELGWIGRDDITIQMIEEAARADRFRLAMSSATQSNSGASAYFGFLYALAGNPDTLTLDMLADEGLLEKVRTLLAQVDRSSGSSGWLKDAYVDKPGVFDAMFNYEALVIEANQALVPGNKEPFYVIYPANGLSVADSPLGYVDKGDPDREGAFLALQAHLLSAEVQSKLATLGRRTGLIGLMAESSDPKVWNPDWGIDTTRAIAPVPTPQSAVIGEALRLYQSELRKPSLTVWVLDVSGSMEGQPLEDLKSAMRLVLDPEAAAVNLLQPSRRDVTILIPFNHATGRIVRVEGTAPAALRKALTAVESLQASGGTDVYGALLRALGELEPYASDGRLFDYLPAIVAMTDGASSTDRLDDFLAALAASPFARDVPIHAIAFGAADEAQLQQLSSSTVGRLFRAGADLAQALRAAKGYN